MADTLIANVPSAVTKPNMTSVMLVAQAFPVNDTLCQQIWEALNHHFV